MIKLIMIKSILDRHDNRRQDAGFSHDRWCRLWAKSEKQKRRGTTLGNWGQDSAGPRFSFTFVQYILNVGPRVERGGIKRPLPQSLAGNSHCLGILTAASRICTWHQINPMLRRSQASCRDNYNPTWPPTYFWHLGQSTCHSSSSQFDLDSMICRAVAFMRTSLHCMPLCRQNGLSGQHQI